MSANTYAVLIREDGSAIRQPLSSDLDKQVDELQKYVDGYFEFVKVKSVLDEGVITMAVNDEGRLRPMKENLTATVVAGQFIAGPAVLMPAPTPEGDVIGFDNDTANKVLYAIGVINEPPF